jgi:hypothetical protein
MIMSETLTWSDPIETEKIRTHHAKIVVECITGKPYYSIEWFDTAKQEYYLGYSSYCIDNVLGWLKEYFEIVEAPKTNADRIRAMSDEKLADAWIRCNTICHLCAYRDECEFDEYVIYEKCKEGIMEWLKQPADMKGEEDG